MITGIILASGFSKRMGEDKLLLKIQGDIMIEKVIREAKESTLDDLILVYRKAEVKKIGEKYNIRTIYNPHAHLGQSAGIKLGIENAKQSDAYMFIMGDQPYLQSQFIDSLILEYRQSDLNILIPRFNGSNGTPTIFSSLYKNDLLNIQGDKGGRDIIKNNPSDIKIVDVDDEKLGFDIDSPEDLKY